MPPAEAAEWLEMLGVKDGGLEALVRATYKTLGLQTYFTSGALGGGGGCMRLWVRWALQGAPRLGAGAGRVGLSASAHTRMRGAAAAAGVSWAAPRVSGGASAVRRCPRPRPPPARPPPARAGEKETRAWTIRRGMTAPQAAGVIHTDFEKVLLRGAARGVAGRGRGVRGGGR